MLNYYTSIEKQSEPIHTKLFNYAALIIRTRVYRTTRYIVVSVKADLTGTTDANVI